MTEDTMTPQSLAPERPETFEAFVERRFSGKLTAGSHSPDGQACFHEALNVWQGREWSADTSGTLDLRGLNDAKWSSDDARTAAMLPLGSLVLAWPSWSAQRRQAWARRVAQETIRRVVPLTLRAAASVHPDPAHKAALEAAAQRCADEGSWSSAWSAARSAESAAWSARSAARSVESAVESAESAAWSVESAVESARSAESAARSARSAASAARSPGSGDEPLRLIAAIFLEATEATEPAMSR